MPSAASNAECCVHILSIQPAREELTAFHTLHVEFFSLEDLWPQPVINFIHRWMHRHSLYNICPSKAYTLSALTHSLMLLAKLPTTDDIREKVAQKCTSLVVESAFKWVEEGLLLQRGHSLGKRTVLRDVWAVYVDRFHELETAILGEVSAEGPHGLSSPRADNFTEVRGGSKKREANAHLSHDMAKIPRTDDERTTGGEATLPQPHEMPGPNGDSKDCIIVGVGESSLLELGLAECSSPHKPDATYPQSSLGHSADSHEGTSPSDCMEEGRTISFQPPPPHNASDILNIRQDQTQEVASDWTFSDQRPSTVLGYAATQDTAPQSPLAPESAPSQCSRTNTPNSQPSPRSEQSPEMESHIHIPESSSTQRLSHTDPSPLDPRQTSEGHPFNTSPPHPDNPSFSPQVSNHVKYVRPGDPTTLEPLVTIDGPPSTPTLHLPANASQHTRSANSSTQKLHSLAQPFMEARPTDRMTPTIARSAPHATPSQIFQVVGRILIPDYDQPGTWALLHVDTLMSRNVMDFYGPFSRLGRPNRALPVLRFELLDMAPELASKFPHVTFISCGDHISFEALKRSVFGCFKATFAKHPTLQMFRIIVTPDLARHSRQASVGDGAEGQGNSSSRTHPLPAVVVRIQVNRHGGVSKPFPKTVLAPTVTNTEFFAWFAKQTGHGGLTGPTELRFSFKDVVPTPKNNIITRGNEEHFEYMKKDIRPMCELATTKIPGLSEFTILITVPGWVLEVQHETW